MRTESPGAFLIDIRTPGEFASGYIVGSVNLPLADLSGHYEPLRTEKRPIVLICRTGRRAKLAESELVNAGVKQPLVLDGGIVAWQDAGFEAATVAGKRRWDLERQVRLEAGGIVATSVLVSRWIPNARYLGGAVGVGLVAAAITDTCAMGMALMKLPYNRAGAAPHRMEHATTGAQDRKGQR